MIRCNRCGNVSPASAGQCQMCGAPLASGVENEQPLENWQTGNMTPGWSGQGQQELPAWLESLRAGEMSAAPPKSPANFTAADLVEEGSLPTWMRSERGETGEVPLRPSGFTAATTGEGGIPKQGFSASSLIDENSLPSWMHEGKKNESAPPPQGFTASSLVDAEALPEWMRQIHPQAQASAPMTPPQQPAPAMPNIAQTPQPASMPAAPEPFTQTPSPFNSTQNAAAEMNSGTFSAGDGFSANSLIDPQALPSWMKEGEAGSAKSPAGAQSFQPGFAASSLIDANALPGWMRENEQGAPSQPSQAASSGGAISASSFIDVNALPSWMREGEGYAQGSAPMGPQGANQAGMRVPSRPRGEVNSTEGSEVAANVFASMLGVASAAPQFPGQAPMQPQQPQQGSAPMGNVSPFMGGAPGAQGPASAGMPQGPASSPMPQPGGYAGSGSLPGMQGAAPGMMGMGQPPQGGSMSGVYNNPYAYGNAPAANPNPYSMGGMGQMPNNMNNLPGAMPSQGGIGPMAEQPRMEPQKPAKRGLFNAIRELFFR